MRFTRDRRWRRIAALGLAGSLAVAGIACGGGGSSGERDAAADEASPGGTLTIATGDESTLDPALNTGLLITQATRLVPIYDALSLEDSRNGEVVNRIAESYESTDASNWTLTLRSGVEFSDGTPYDAEAVAAHWNRVKAPETNAPDGPIAQNMESITVVDAQTLSVVLTSPDAQWPRTLSRSVLTLVPSPTALAEKGAVGFASAPVGAGPFVVESYVEDSELVLARNPDFYGEEAYLDRVVYKTIVDLPQRIATMQSGGADIIQDSSSPDSAASFENVGLDIYTTSGVGGRVITFNMAEPPFDDIRARQAIAMAVDREALNQALYQGNATPAETIFTESSPFFDESLSQIEPDRAQAQELFDEYAADTGGPMTITFITIPVYRALTDYLQTVFSEYENVRLNVELITQQDIAPRQRAGNFNLSISNIYGVDLDVAYDYLHSAGARNYANWNNAEGDEALDTARTSLSEDERGDAYAVLQEQILEDLPAVFLTRLTAAYGFDADVVHIDQDRIYSYFGLPYLNEVWKS